MFQLLGVFAEFMWHYRGTYQAGLAGARARLTQRK
jgi:hypothetical protein